MITLPERKTPKTRSSGPFTSVHYTDVHFPFESREALEVLYQVLEDVQPQIVVNHGDLLDCTGISKFEKDPLHRVSLQDEIELGALHLARVSSIVPDAEKILLEGNHEDRLRRTIWEATESNPKLKEIIRLRGVMEALDLPSLLGCDGLGWEYVRTKRVLFDKLILKHGNVVRKWGGWSAKGEYDRYGKSGMSGHTHRRGVFEHRDYNGFHAWWELGCMCDLDPSYCTDPDWANGFAVVTWTEDRAAFGVEEVRIHEGQALFRGKVYGR